MPRYSHRRHHRYAPGFGAEGQEALFYRLGDAMGRVMPGRHSRGWELAMVAPSGQYSPEQLHSAMRGFTKDERAGFAAGVALRNGVEHPWFAEHGGASFGFEWSRLWPWNWFRHHEEEAAVTSSPPHDGSTAPDDGSGGAAPAAAPPVVTTSVTPPPTETVGGQDVLTAVFVLPDGTDDPLPPGGFHTWRDRQRWEAQQRAQWEKLHGPPPGGWIPGVGWRRPGLVLSPPPPLAPALVVGPNWMRQPPPPPPPPWQGNILIADGIHNGILMPDGTTLAPPSMPAVDGINHVFPDMRARIEWERRTRDTWASANPNYMNSPVYLSAPFYFSDGTTYPLPPGGFRVWRDRQAWEEARRNDWAAGKVRGTPVKRDGGGAVVRVTSGGRFVDQPHRIFPGGARVTGPSGTVTHVVDPTGHYHPVNPVKRGPRMPGAGLPGPTGHYQPPVVAPGAPSHIIDPITKAPTHVIDPGTGKAHPVGGPGVPAPSPISTPVPGKVVISPPSPGGNGTSTKHIVDPVTGAPSHTIDPVTGVGTPVPVGSPTHIVDPGTGSTTHVVDPGTGKAHPSGGPGVPDPSPGSTPVPRSVVTTPSPSGGSTTTLVDPTSGATTHVVNPTTGVATPVAPKGSASGSPGVPRTPQHGAHASVAGDFYGAGVFGADAAPAAAPALLQLAGAAIGMGAAVLPPSDRAGAEKVASAHPHSLAGMVIAGAGSALHKLQAFWHTLLHPSTKVTTPDGAVVTTLAPIEIKGAPSSMGVDPPPPPPPGMPGVPVGPAFDPRRRDPRRGPVPHPGVIDPRHHDPHAPGPWLGGFRRGPGAPPPGPAVQSMGSSLANDQTLSPGQSLVSPNGAYRLTLGADGNVILSGPGGQQLWSTGTAGSGGICLRMQADGNLVLYDAPTNVKWASGTNVRFGTSYASGSTLTLQNDGNLVIYTPGNQAVWSTNTVQGTPQPPPQLNVGAEGHRHPRDPRAGGRMGSTLAAGRNLRPGTRLASPSGQYGLELTADGNVVVRGPGGATLWNAGISGATALVMQADGNLVAVHGRPPTTSPLWASGTNGQGGQAITMQDDGNLVMLDPTTKIVWATNTYQGGSGVPGPA